MKTLKKIMKGLRRAFWSPTANFQFVDGGVYFIGMMGFTFGAAGLGFITSIIFSSLGIYAGAAFLAYGIAFMTWRVVNSPHELGESFQEAKQALGQMRKLARSGALKNDPAVTKTIEASERLIFDLWVTLKELTREGKRNPEAAAYLQNVENWKKQTTKVKEALGVVKGLYDEREALGLAQSRSRELLSGAQVTAEGLAEAVREVESTQKIANQSRLDIEEFLGGEKLAEAQFVRGQMGSLS